METDSFFRRAFTGAIKDSLVEWPNAVLTSLPNSDDIPAINSLAQQVLGSCRRLLTELLNISAQHFVLDHVHHWSMQMLSELPPCTPGYFDFSTSSRSSSDFSTQVVPRKMLEGPKQQALDRRYRRDISALDYQASFIDDPHLIIRYFWCLSSRECVAADLAALNIAEYDMMPLEFYWDSAKQAYDEARHAQSYFDLSISLYPRVAQSLPKDSEIRGIMDEFLELGTGLPIPAEGNHYPAICDASLVERLVLMNIMTETPAVGRKRDHLRSHLAAKYSDIGMVIEVDLYDEMFHAVLGKKWLEYMYPDKPTRDAALLDAMLLRGFLLSLSVAEGGKRDPIEFLREATASIIA